MLWVDEYWNDRNVNSSYEECYSLKKRNELTLWEVEDSIFSFRISYEMVFLHDEASWFRTTRKIYCLVHLKIDSDESWKQISIKFIIRQENPTLGKMIRFFYFFFLTWLLSLFLKGFWMDLMKKKTTLHKIWIFVTNKNDLYFWIIFDQEINFKLIKTYSEFAKIFFPAYWNRRKNIINFQTHKFFKNKSS